MNASVEEWLQKAEDDFRVAEYELARPDKPVFDAVCYHSQQCIEEMMKAILVLHGQTPPYTHDLLILSAMVTDIVPGWSCDTNDLRFLTLAAAHFRYPGDSSDRGHAERAISICSSLRARMNSALKRHQ